MSTKRQLLIWLATISALLAVFAMYTQPEFLMTLANQIWACF